MIRLPPMHRHLSYSRRWSCVGAFEPGVLRWPESNAGAWGKPGALGQPCSGIGWAGEDPLSHCQQILAVRQPLESDTPYSSLKAPLGHHPGGRHALSTTTQVFIQFSHLKAPTGFSNQAFSFASSAMPRHVDGPHPPVNRGNSLLSSLCQSQGGRTRFLDPSLVSNCYHKYDLLAG